MDTAVGYPVSVRGFLLALTVQGLRPHTITNYVRDVERFATQHYNSDPGSITPDDIRSYILTLRKRCAAKTVYEALVPVEIKRQSIQPRVGSSVGSFDSAQNSSAAIRDLRFTPNGITADRARLTARGKWRRV